MLINVDAKALEWATVTYHSQDQVALEEIRNGADQHTDNQDKFNLPSRLIAKKFVFQLIFGGSAYGYANNPDFSDAGDEKYWQKVIDRFYEKYKGIAAWHKKIVHEAIMTGKLTTQTGRTYRFKPDNYSKWPLTTIKNYPVQGLAADLMSIVRISAYNRLKKMNCRDKVLLISTVHDSIIADCHNDVGLIYDVCCMFEDIFTDLPKNFEKIYGLEYNVPMRGEVEFGLDWKNTVKFERKFDKQQIKQFLLDGIK